MTKNRTAILCESHFDRSQRMKEEIIELTEKIHEIEYCTHSAWISSNPKKSCSFLMTCSFVIGDSAAFTPKANTKDMAAIDNSFFIT